MVIIRSAIAFSALLFVAAADGQRLSDKKILEMLEADSAPRTEFINKNLAALRPKQALLLRWTEHAPTPSHMEPVLFRGLAEAFEDLQTEEAVPFLIKHIDDRDLFMWKMKSPSAVRLSMRFVRALIAIGTPALPQLKAAYSGPLTPDQRALVLLTIATIGHDPATIEFLRLARVACEREIEFIGGIPSQPPTSPAVRP